MPCMPQRWEYNPSGLLSTLRKQTLKTEKFDSQTISQVGLQEE